MHVKNFTDRVTHLSAVLTLILLLSTLTQGVSTETEKSDAYPDEAVVQVYVIGLTDVGNYRASNGSMVVDGALQATEVKEATVGLGFDGFTDVNVTISSSVVTEWNEYETLVETAGKVIIVNAHDEYLPVPDGYTKEEWVDQIADFMLNRQGTWVHTGGYPLYRVWFENGTKQEWGEEGFQRLMSHINKGNVTCWPPEGEEDEIATFAGGADQQLGLSWKWWDGKMYCPIGTFAEACVGRPLKRDDFKDYLMLCLYTYYSQAENKRYWVSGVVAFSPYPILPYGDPSLPEGWTDLSPFNFGFYVHMGIWKFYPSGYHDLAMGFISTAAAVWMDVCRPIEVMYDVHDEIRRAQQGERTYGLDRALALLQNSTTAYEDGDYKKSIFYAVQARETAENATKPPNDTSLTVASTIIAIVAFIGAGAWILNRRKNKKT